MKSALELWVILLMIYGFTGIAYILWDSETPLFSALSVIPEATAILAYCRVQEPHLLKDLFRSKSFSRKGFLLIPPVFLALLGFQFLYEWLVALATTGDDWSLLEPYLSYGWPLWTAFLLISVTPGFFEELAFRGFIQAKLERVMGPKESLVVQAAMFSVLHLEPTYFATSFFFGLALAWLRRTTGSLIPGMLIHAAWNAMVLGWELGW